MKKTISRFALRLINSCFFISLTLSIGAQCNTPVEAAESCNFLFMLDATALEDGFCASLPESNPLAELTPLCLGLSSSENTGFFTFEPIVPEVTFKITPMNCTAVEVPGQGVFIGMQAAIFDDCTFMEYRACSPTCQIGAFNIGANDFEPFQTYILVFDGCNGSVCDFTIEVESGAISGLVPLSEPILNSPEEVCQDEVSEIEVIGLPLVTKGGWTIDGDVNFDVRFNGKAIRVNDWGTPGIKSICATINDPDDTEIYYDSCWQVMVNSTPIVVSLSESDSLCLDEEIDLTFEATGYDSFSWTWDGGSCNNCPFPVFTMLEEETTVTLTLSFEGNCEVVDSVVYYPEDVEICIVGTSNLNELEVQLQPNPFQSQLEMLTFGIFDLKVFDSQGRLLLQETGRDQLSIDGSAWSNGLYFLELNDSAGNASIQKIIKN